MTREPSNPLTLTLQILRDEGPRAVWNRLLDLREERRRLRGLTELAEKGGRLSIDFEPPPVLNVSPVPPSPMRGGAQIQMMDRLAEEKKLRTVALVYPRGGEWWMEIWAASNSWILPLGSAGDEIDVVERAAKLAGTAVVHIENLFGLPLGLVKDLKGRGFAIVLSVHDFNLFCRKPHLVERTTGEFCDYCRDHRRCELCLDDIDPERSTSQDDYRRAGAEAFGSADLVIYPSRFIQIQHETLFPGLRLSGREVVIPPASRRRPSSAFPSKGPPRIAFVGGVYSHRGGELILPTMQRVRDRIHDAEGFVYGNGESRLFRVLKGTRSLRIHGYYRQGTLPSLLDRDKISVAVLPSVCPESYSLVSDECLSAGVAVIAFDHGAVADRLIAWGVGRLVPLHQGAIGLADAIFELVARDCTPPNELLSMLPQSFSTGCTHIEIYESLAADHDVQSRFASHSHAQR